jgi:hypothetical protein
MVPYRSSGVKMRLLIIAVLVPIISAACGAPRRADQETSSAPYRDLTLSSTSVVSSQVTSGIELAREQPTRQVHRARRSPMVAPASAETREPKPISGGLPAPERVAPAPAPAEALPPDPSGRELAPGATVTIIPVSAVSPASSDPGGWSEVPAPRPGGGVMIVGGRGGHCGGGRGGGPVSILR